MVHWNYRIIKRHHDLQQTVMYSIHEVYYEGGEEIVSWSEEPITITSYSTKNGLKKQLNTILEDAWSVPVLDYDKLLKSVSKVFPDVNRS